MIPFLVNFFAFPLLFKLGSATGPSCSAVYVTIEEPSVQETRAKFTYSGKENFDSLTKPFYSSFVSNFGMGKNSGIQATFYDVHIAKADMHGGVGGSGMYAISNKNGKHVWMNFTKTGEEGINSVGFWISAAGPEDAFRLFSQGSDEVFHFVAKDIWSYISPSHENNPNFPENIVFPYFYVTIFVDGCTISAVQFSGGTGEYEFDDVRVGKWDTLSGTVVISATTTSATTIPSSATTTSATTIPSSATTIPSSATTIPSSATTTTTTKRTKTPPVGVFLIAGGASAGVAVLLLIAGSLTFYSHKRRIGATKSGDLLEQDSLEAAALERDVKGGIEDEAFK